MVSGAAAGARGVVGAEGLRVLEGGTWYKTAALFCHPDAWLTACSPEKNKQTGSLDRSGAPDAAVCTRQGLRSVGGRL